MTDFAPPAPPPEPPHEPAATFRVPADYYSSPPGEVRPLFPRWVPIGCGSAAAAFLLLVFIAGSVVAHRGMGRIMSMLIDSMQDEIGGMYTKDVTPPQKKALHDELAHLGDNLRAEKVPLAKLDPVMKTLRDAISDQRITAPEAQKITAAVHELNTAPPPPPKPKR